MSRSIPVGYALANLPRYTSYPTAPHFGPLEEATYRAWLGGIRPVDPLSLYLHIPFCASLCWYCGCTTAVTRNPDRIARYGAALAQEAALLAAALPAHAGVAAIHLGGGTPSTLGADGLRALFAALRTEFGLRPGAELAIELDPRVLTEEVVAALAEAGVTRASLGVQDIDPAVQRRIGRTQPEAMVARGIGWLRAAGIRAINLDLMYGLPGQTTAQVAATARFAAQVGADRVAVFGYAHVPWMKPHQNAIHMEQLPGALERLQQAEAAEQVLAAEGFEAIGLDHFARPADAMAVAAREGTLRRNFQGYTTDAAPVLLGLGASAIGGIEVAGYAQNEPNERRWVAAVQAGTLPVRRGRAVTAEDRLRRHCIERVMCDFALDLAALPPALVADVRPALAPLASDGLIDLAPETLRVTAAGRRHVRHVAAAFDAYLASGAARHSAAV
ncbi:oxygen-independent coproporphyrinogen III oxidase [Paracraurococcus ruber]|uniref:Coproporphyrinogen-III oxidase n=1 Tax=Paracraurococcus ruber TaxID=77675 RepID=A0ABS1D026_9PROT|nr:oxygen-independent coproporphyrinogen III oxidase [Paracraurococcus ruber]MBK1660149.1 oxygen-independent coproporphyrinogen III oxidase [Paracraurococcus ruber]TDG32460.1 oxygen-independent coproporphyrinogen III oxidase [Paracraurococcus ruber]